MKVLSSFAWPYVIPNLFDSIFFCGTQYVVLDPIDSHFMDKNRIQSTFFLGELFLWFIFWNIPMDKTFQIDTWLSPVFKAC